MADETRPRTIGTARGAVRRRFARMASIGGLFLLSVAFAAMPVAADKHGGNGGTGSDDKVQAGQKHDDASHGQDRVANEPGDDRGMVENEPGDDRGMVENEPGDDKGQAENEPGDDHGVDANGAPILLLRSPSR